MIESKIKKCYTIFMSKNFTFFEKLNLPIEIAENQLYFVGGTVRSILQDKNLPKDIDICGNFDIAKLADLNLGNKQYIKQLHSLRFKLGEFDVDLTAFRKEEYKKGYFPSKVQRVETPFEDSLRRDFTINAVYINSDGEVFDYHNGISHMQEKKIVQVGENTLQFDGMRIYRMVRFALTLGYQIEKSTLECAYANSDNIFQISKARGKVEFDKFAKYITPENISMIEKLGIMQHLEISR